MRSEVVAEAAEEVVERRLPQRMQMAPILKLRSYVVDVRATSLVRGWLVNGTEAFWGQNLPLLSFRTTMMTSSFSTLSSPAD